MWTLSNVLFSNTTLLPPGWTKLEPFRAVNLKLPTARPNYPLQASVHHY